MLESVVSTAAIVLAISRSWPQVFRILRSEHTGGVSPSTWSLTLASGTTWEIIGLVEKIGPTIFFNVFGIAASTSVLLALGRHRQVSYGLPFVVIAGAVALNLVLYWAVGAIAVSVLGVGLALVMFMPQAVHVFTRGTEGISITSWVIAFFTQTLWSWYGFLIAEPVLAVPGFVMSPLAALIVWKTWLDNRRGVTERVAVGVE